MQPADPEGLYRRLLTERAKLAVQLAEQGEIRTGNRRKHQKQS